MISLKGDNLVNETQMTDYLVQQLLVFKPEEREVIKKTTKSNIQLGHHCIECVTQPDKLVQHIVVFHVLSMLAHDSWLVLIQGGQLCHLNVQ